MSKFAEHIYDEMMWAYPQGGGLDREDIDGLYELVHKNPSQNMTIVDVGCWTGMSTVALALACKEYNGTVKAIDWFQGSKHTGLANAAKEADIRKLLEARLRYYDIHNVEIIAKTSKDACETMLNNSADVVFLDADHRFIEIKHDIKRWWPKVKSGGIFCGHDCEFIISPESRDWQMLEDSESNPWNNLDCINFHIGVVRAVSCYVQNPKKLGARLWWTQKIRQ